MVKINENFLSMEKNYLFIDIAKKVKAFTEAHPDKPLIRMGIGDVTLPLAPVVVEAIKKAADEMGVKETFRGYEDSGAGYDFLREAIADYYKSFGISLNISDIRVNDGAKSDCGNITDIFGEGNTVLVTDPAYPVYVDSNVMAGRKIIYADSNEANGFAAMPDSSVHADIIYLCSPNNPTGSVYTKEQLAAWVDYALENEAVIIFDSAYEAFISDPSLPRSIYAVPGAKKCAIEMCSLSKTAGFTGTR
ncbi:MAG: aminotransferase class I/II-fold pyridoxal phosphate-dependent enzyme, partial [Oscillospiraceae bacterium]|nr:aminotransferase class I/II-fold pyridoxal phosphate-dependent enzyme [Oscillospiraceae bacterium]